MSGQVAVKILLTAATAVICGQVIKGKTPALALTVSLAAIAVLTGLVWPLAQALWRQIGGLLEGSGLDKTLLLPLAKVLAITQITRVTAELCRDAGERGLAAKLEFCGAVASTLCVLPLAEQALRLIGTLGA
ncbi:MAG: hypothetical protein IKU58_04115 [Clostridia bacterium]|nr:hypothetical protein [Clostridia bacterium]